MADGTVKWFDMAKGFGLIVPDDLTRAVFVHYSCIEGAGYRGLTEGQRVDFDSESAPRGPRATRVRSLSGGRLDRRTSRF